jgi:hypothetical protein
MNLDQVRSYVEKHFSLNAPLGESEVAAFEAANRIVLPDEYRSFLLYLGNGGSDRSIFKLPLFRMGRAGEYQKLMSRLDQPFPLEAGFYAEDDRDPVDHYLQGLLPFHHEGCGIHFALVITGSERGNVWVIDFTNSDFLLPLPEYSFILPQYAELNIQRISFFEWFKWYDDCLTYLHERRLIPKSDGELPF